MATQTSGTIDSSTWPIGHDAWEMWCEGVTTATASSTWCYWNTGSSIQAHRVEAPCRWAQPAETAAQRERRKKLAEGSAAAEEKAKQLLLESLDEQQRQEYGASKKFHVVSASGQRYEVDCRKKMHNVFRLDEQGKPKTEYCIYQKGDCPLPDNHLAQKLLLEADEGEFLRLANARAVG